MLSNRTERKGTAKWGAWLLRRAALSLLLALLALGFVGMSPGLASTSVPLRPTVVSTQQADAAPSMAAYGAVDSVPYVGWTGRNTAHNLNLMSVTNNTFGPVQVLTDTTLAGAGPSLTTYARTVGGFFNAYIYVAWIGTDHRLNVARYNLADPRHLADKVTLREYSNQAPFIAAFTGRLYLSWRGTDGRLNIMSSADGSTFNTKVTYNIAIRTSPTLVRLATISTGGVTKNYLFVAWEDMSASSHIVFAQYNPSNPAVLDAVVTTASTSTFPVSLYPASDVQANTFLKVAWRTATDAHIRLATFEGGQFLHDPVYTTETTPYGPTLYQTTLCWTGTDAAQSINVMQVNL